MLFLHEMERKPLDKPAYGSRSPPPSLADVQPLWSLHRSFGLQYSGKKRERLAGRDISKDRISKA
jgi:hypothetical protein